MLDATAECFHCGEPFAGRTILWTRLKDADVPVSLGLLLAYFASVFNTWRHVGEVYFDSVTMFIFFLTVARYVEMVARHKSASVTDSLSRLLPDTAHRVVRDESGDHLSDVAVSQLRVGDILMVRAGEIVPADGDLLDVRARIDESMLTSESLPVSRGPGERLAAGTINVDTPLHLRVAAVGSSTILSSIVALLNRAQSERPRITRAADRTASRFLAKVLIGAAVVCAVWSVIDPSRAFGATLAVLVVACPCALLLATLTAVASANAALRAQGLGVEILSGDAQASVARVAQHCGVDQFAARQSPADKLERVRTLTAGGEFVAMVGDGWAFFWAVASGQFDELDAAAWDILSDEDDTGTRKSGL